MKRAVAITLLAMAMLTFKGFVVLLGAIGWVWARELGAIAIQRVRGTSPVERPRTFVLGDIHGAARALEQVFERSSFSPAEDRLICLGDICDGWPDVDRCFDLLLEVRDLTVILGNHDEWALSWMNGETPPVGWLAEGGAATVESYASRIEPAPPMTVEQVPHIADAVPTDHSELLRWAEPFLIEDGGSGGRRLFTHAGWNPDRPPDRQTSHDLRLGRDLWIRAWIREGTHADRSRQSLSGFDEVYLGHTPTEWREPRQLFEIWNLDQGAGWDGVLTLMDVDTHDYWQSDPVPELYPEATGRGAG